MTAWSIASVTVAERSHPELQADAKNLLANLMICCFSLSSFSQISEQVVAFRMDDADLKGGGGG